MSLSPVLAGVECVDFEALESVTGVLKEVRDVGLLV